jgi:ankyrin repeat protein
VVVRAERTAALVAAARHGSLTAVSRYPPDRQSLVDVFVRLACLTYADWHPSNVARAGRMLEEHPELSAESMHTASAAGNTAAVRRMIDRDPALVNAKGGPLNWEPLLYACYSRLEPAGHDRSTFEVARLLLSRGADPNAGFLYDGSYAFTALTGVFGRGEDWPNQPPHPECERLARLLLDAGADPNDGQTLYNRHFQEDDEHLTLLFEYGLGRDRGGPWLRQLTDENATPSRMLVQQLCWAAAHGFAGRVTLLVERGVDVNATSPRTGRTAYQEAFRAGHHRIAEYLLEHGAEKVEPDALETFALACVAGRRDEVRARLAADPTLLERLGERGRVELLHRASDAKGFEGVRLIVELGVNINGMVPGTAFDRAVLHNAAGWGGLEMVKFLIGLGADPHLPDLTFRARPIGWAMHGGQREVVEYLLPLASVFDAVQCGGVEHVAALLDEDTSRANARDEDGNPLVFYLHPQMERLDEMIRVLAAHDADFNARDSNGRTLLERAAARGWTELADAVRAHVEP